MQHTSTEKISEALKLLEEAATQKKDELKSVMSDKYTHLRDFIVETEGSLAKSLSDAKDDAVGAATHMKDVEVKNAFQLARDVDKKVHHDPWPYILGAAAVGLLFGYIRGRNGK